MTGRVGDVGRSRNLRGRALLAVLLSALLVPRGAGASDPPPEAPPTPTPAGTVISNDVDISWVDGNGSMLSATSAAVLVTVGQIAAVSVAPSHSVTVAPGNSITLEHLIGNLGNGLDCLTVTVAASAGLVVQAHLLAAGESASTTPINPPLAGCVTLAAGAVERIVLVIQITPSAPNGPASVTVSLVSAFDPTVSAQVADQLLVFAPAAMIALVKTGTPDTVTLGDVITYTVSYSVTGTGSLPAVVIRDTLVAGLDYVAGSVTFDGVALTDLADGDAGVFDMNSRVLAVDLGTVTVGDTGVISFEARVAASQPGTRLTNGAFVSSGGGPSSGSNGTVSTVVEPQADLQKSLTGPVTIRIGEETRYQIRYENDSPILIRGAEVVDTLAAGLEHVSSSPPAAVEGRVLRWTVGDLGLGQGGTIDVVVRGVDFGADSAHVRNRAWLGSQNGLSESAEAEELLIVGLSPRDLRLEISTTLLEVAGGETVPYAIELANQGSIPLAGIVVTDSLPAGMTLRRPSVVGADSLRVEGRLVTFWVSGPILPAESHVIRYLAALTEPGGRIFRNVASAIAEGGFVMSEVAVALSRAREDWPLESRVAIGRVWVDLDGDAEFDAGETGVDGIDIWTEDGTVVTTDEDGKFSFRDLRPGGHAFQLDGATLPSSLRLADARDGVVTLTASGWTSPLINFRLVPRSGTLTSVSLLPAGSSEVESPGERAAEPAPTVTRDVAGGLAPPPVRLSPRSESPSMELARPVASRPVRMLAPAEPVPGPGGSVRMVQTAFGSVAVSEPNTAAPQASSQGARGSPIPRRAEPKARRSGASAPGLPPHQPTVPAEVEAPGPGPELPEPITLDSIPDAGTMEAGAQLVVMLKPSDAGWPEVTYPLPTGWEHVASTTRLAGHPADDPEVRIDRDGGRVLFWRFDQNDSIGPVAVRLETVGGPDGSPPRIPSLRSAEERAADGGESLVAGPGVAFFAPNDGDVVSRDQIFVGVRGEAGTPVGLFDGDSLVAETTMRIDGVADFIAVRLARGPHRLRVRMRNSWNQVRWDSLAIHVTGLPRELVTAPDRISLVADGHAMVPVRVRLLDAWGVPVIDGPRLTAYADGAVAVGPDADPSAPGLQIDADEAGWVSLRLRPERTPGEGSLFLESGDARRRVDLELLPETRSLIVTGYGRGGVGAAADPFFAITARGRLDARTSLTLAYDTRRLDSGRDFFGRGYDPLEESRLPVPGDASQQRLVGASQRSFAARVERGLDWFAVGDMRLDDFTEGLRLTRYRRALTGAQGKWGAGPIELRGFGSLTTQSLQQRQIRGLGTSGPYEIGSGVRPGTERVVIQARDLLNAQRVLNEEPLAAFIDYQIDYQSGTLVLKRPVPAADTYGNPLFIVLTYEADGGEEELVAGVRASVALDEIVDLPGVDSLRVGLTGVSGGGEAGAEHYLAGADARMRTGLFEVGVEISYSTLADSASAAIGVDGAVRLGGDRGSFDWRWTRVGDRYFNPSDIALTAGTEQLSFGARYSLGWLGTLNLQHERQLFKLEGIHRTQSQLRLERGLGLGLRASAGLTADGLRRGDNRDEALAGEVELEWRVTPKLSLIAEGRDLFSSAGDIPRPDHIGFGVDYRLSDRLTLESRQRFVRLEADSTSYSVTEFGLRSKVAAGTEVRGAYQLVGGGDAAQNAAVIGLNNQFRLGNAFRVQSNFERRVGVDRASAEDPVRALPFVRPEGDYWAASLGLEWLPENDPYKLIGRGELREGDFLSTRLFTLGGEVAFNRSLALLSRQEFRQTVQARSSRPDYSRRRSSLWGLAYRPFGGDALQLLGKFEWIDETNPIGGGVLTSRGREARLIGIAEAIWAPRPRVELAARYATRFSESDVQDSGEQRLVDSRADYVGARGRVGLTSWLSAGFDARLLHEHTTSATPWNFSPLMLFEPLGLFEVEAGYRVGDLRDPDFSVRGGKGGYVTVGAGLTTGRLRTLRSLWRNPD